MVDWSKPILVGGEYLATFESCPHSSNKLVRWDSYQYDGLKAFVDVDGVLICTLHAPHTRDGWEKTPFVTNEEEKTWIGLYKDDGFDWKIDRCGGNVYYMTKKDAEN